MRLGEPRRSEQRGSPLKSEVSELKAAHAKDKRLVHYLLSDAFDRRGPWVTGVRIDGKTYGRATRHSSPGSRSSSRRFPRLPEAEYWSPAP